MRFFEPPPPVDEPEFRYPESGPWTRPPELTFAGILPMNQVLARTDEGVVVLPEIRAYRTGCWFEIAAAVRRPAAQAARRRIWNTMAGVTAEDDQLPAELLRFGVRYGDGTTATTLRRVPGTVQEGVPAPDPPVLYHRPQHGGEAGGSEWIELHLALWLWPLPPAETFELVLEYPVIGVPETSVSIDGAAIAAAAATSAPFVRQG